MAVVPRRRQNRRRFDPWVGKIPWRRGWLLTQALLPRESHGWRSLAGYSPWGRKESATTGPRLSNETTTTTTSLKVSDLQRVRVRKGTDRTPEVDKVWRRSVKGDFSKLGRQQFICVLPNVFSREAPAQATSREPGSALGDAPQCAGDTYFYHQL